MKYLTHSFLVFILAVTINFTLSAAEKKNLIQTTGTHQIWDLLLKKHVSTTGNVNYKGFLQDKEKLENYISQANAAYLLGKMTSKEQLAYWINIYNANTIKLVIDNYPVSSITEIKRGDKKTWDIPFIKIGSKMYSLNNIENDIIRKKYNEPRIHFAVNCASVGCPELRNEAFTASKLETQLQEQTKKFINDNSKNTINSSSVEISKLFDWYKADFTKNGTVIDFINKYSTTKASSNAKISYKEYSWKLNSK